MFDSYSLKHRPDQTVSSLNQIKTELNRMRRSIRVVSDDGKKCIIIGRQEINPQTGKPYPFGIEVYNIKGDRLEKI